VPRPQYTAQRVAKPDYGLREEILLPWYTELARQYLSRPYGAQWTGNRTLLDWYERAAYDAGENRYGMRPRVRWGNDDGDGSKEAEEEATDAEVEPEPEERAEEEPEGDVDAEDAGAAAA
jgi:hypothetical protein